MPSFTEAQACTPIPIDPRGFNPKAIMPYGVTPKHVGQAMQDWIDFIGFVNVQLHSRQIERLESFLMPANFSSIVGEFIGAAIPKHCPTICRNAYHNGHPDLIPKGMYPKDSIQHGPDGIEIKGSRHVRGWQGHNAEDTWLMVCVFDSNAAKDKATGIGPRPFQFIKIVGAKIAKTDWTFSGRSATSRRTITASVNQSGFAKMEANWIYRA